MATSKASKPKKAGTKSGKKKTKLSPIARRARTLGLESMGYGRWGKLGRVTHRTSGGKLVEVTDSKHNRKKTREGKDNANAALTKLKHNYAVQMVKLKTAIKRAEGRGDEAAVRKYTSMYDKVKSQGQKAHERAVKLKVKKKA